MTETTRVPKTTDRVTTKSNRYRSGLEREAARQLELAGCPFGYESEIIPYTKPAKAAKYHPDLILTKKDGSKMYIEMKGRFVTEDRQKHLLLRAQYPEIDLRIVFQNANAKISKTSSTTYRKWAESKGIKFSDKGRIPKEWIKECI